MNYQAYDTDALIQLHSRSFLGHLDAKIPARRTANTLKVPRTLVASAVTTASMLCSWEGWERY